MRKCNMKKYPKPKYYKNSFKDLWSSIIQNSDTNIKSNESKKKADNDLFFTEVPFSQEFLAESHQIFRNKLQYDSFIQIPANQINKLNLYDCFHGILFYIYYYSENKFNIKELEFHFSGAPSYNILTANTNPDQANIINIFDYKNINNEFSLKPIKNAFFGIKFKQINVTPIAYSIRSGINNTGCSHLISFTFEGFDEQSQKWIILDERMNINNLIPTGSFSLFFVRYTKNSFSSFRIVQTDPGNNGLWGFSISAFDIHGIVSLNENTEPLFDFSAENQLLLNESETNIGTYDPIIDMSEFLF